MNQLSALSQQTPECEITEPKRTEVDVHESERRLATLLANLPGMAYRCRNDSHWTMEFVSEGCCPLTGYQPAELVGNRLVGYDEIIHPEDRSRVRGGVQLGIAQRRQFQLTYRIRTSQGEQKCVWEQGVAICSDDGQVVALEGFITDITDRMRLETELRLSHGQLEQRVRDRTAELQAIYDGMVDGLLIADIEMQCFVQGNGAAARMLGYDVAELPSLPVVEIHPADQLPWILERFGEHAAGRVAPSLDMPYRRKDGSVFHVDVSTSRIMYQDRPCLMGFLRDVTERRQAEVDLRTEKETLRRLLLASDHERRVIAYEIHDTIAQQLAGAALHLEGYLRSKETRPDRAAEAFDAGLHALRECQTDIRRLIAGVRPMNLDETGVEAAIRYLVRSLDGEPGPAVEFHCEVQFQRLKSLQENAICRIVQEGLRNARKHSHSPSVGIELRQHGDRIRLVVQDWGTGFDPAEIGEYHFGLDAIRERARLLGGHAQIESRLGGGTCITVDLPLLAREDDE